MSLRMRVLLASAAVTLIVLPGIAVARAGTGGNTDGDAQMIADAKKTESAFTAAYNEKKWDEVGALYTEDAVLLPPNQDPVVGRAAIVEFLKSARDAFGEISVPSEYVRASASGKLADLVGKFTAQSGRVRMIYQGLYERQLDGSVLMAVDHPAFIDPMG